MKDSNEFFLGFILSIASWETWENIFISLMIAFLGGMLAAAGKALHTRIYTHFNKRRKLPEPHPFDQKTNDDEKN